MKKLALLVGALFFVGTSFTQVTPLKNNSQTSSPPTTEKCSQHVHMAELQQQDPARYATIMQGSVEPLKIHYTAPTETEKITGLVYTIPVVFHIIHNNGVENISDAQILDQLAILNRDFRRLNADADAVASAFIGMPTDAEIEFKLATVAPNGACFNGITRTVSTLTNNGSNGQNQVNAVIAGNDVYQGVWPHNQYLNVYVAADIGGAAGYTFLPNGTSAATATNMYYNGVFILHDYCGSIGTSSTYSSRALTHEFGHWLNLPHVWGANNNPGSAGCGGTDGVQDTPDTQGSTSCTLTANTCSTDNAFWGFNQIDNVENYMDYSYCSKMYTQGQVTKMRTALTSSTGGRNNIWTTANLQAVGAMVGTSLCAVDFSATQTTMCTGTTVTYSTTSTAGISAYSWSFPGGTPATSTAASPTVTYNTAGVYNASVTLTSSANGSTYPKSKTNYITVNANTVGSLPISEGFVSTTFPPAGWTIVNPSNPSTGTSGTWARNATIGRAPTAGNSMFFDNYNINDPSDDEVHLSKFTTTGMTSAQLVFDVAYAPYDANNYDGLQVLVSTDCGATFTSVYSKSNTVLATATATTGAFTPSAAQWRSETVSLTPFIGQSSVLVVFKNLSGYGNRLFVDNINITGVTGTVPPVASFTSGSATICAGQSITYTNTSTNSPTSYSWSFPGGTPSTSTAANPTVTYATAGTYNVSMTATNAGGSNTSTMTNYVTVNPVPSAPTISAGGPLTFCAGGSVVLTSSVGSGNTWSTGATTPSITVSSSGNYTVTTTASGCTSASSAATAVTVNPVPSAPTISAGGPLTFCAGGSVVLTSSVGSGNTWSTGATTPSITVSSSGNYTVTTTASGCTSASSAATAVTVNAVPSAPTISAGGPLTFCAGGSVVLTSSAGSGNMWSTGATTPSITVSSSGNYTVTTTASGCTSPASAATAVTVNPVPTAPTISAGGPLTFCAGGSVVLTSSAGSGNTWSTGATTPSITVSSSGNYTVTTTASGCTSASSAATAVTVNPVPTAPTISAGGPLTFCAGGSVVLTSSAGSGNTWSTGATTPSITVSSSGNYTVTTTASGCTSPSSAATSVTVNPTPTVTLGTITNPTVCGANGSIAVNGSGTGDISWTGTSTGSMTGVTLPSLVTATAGTYDIVFTSAAGCASNSLNASLTDPGAPNAPTISASGPTDLCQGESVVLTSSAGSGNTWSTGETTPSITVSSAGAYTVTFTSGACTSGNSNTINVTVTAPTAASFSPISAFCSGATAPSLPSTSTNGISGTWNPSTISNTASGSYVFTPNSGQCATGATISVTVNPAPTVSFGSVNDLCVYNSSVTLTQGSPSGGTYSGPGVSGAQFDPAVAGVGNATLTYDYTDGNGCSGSAQTVVNVDDCAGINEAELTTVLLYPNPSTGLITIDAGAEVVKAVRVFNALGQLVYEQTENLDVTNEINLPNIASGVYTVRVQTEVGTQHIPVMIQK